jgi:hypothetical protein
MILAVSNLYIYFFGLIYSQQRKSCKRVGKKLVSSGIISRKQKKKKGKKSAWKKKKKRRRKVMVCGQ